MTKSLTNNLKCFIILFLFTTSLLHAQQDKVEQIDKFINQLKKQYQSIPGLAVAIVKDNNTILTKGYGYADLNKNIKADKNTAFYIASTTKSFIGALATILEHKGQLNLSAPLSSYKPFKELSNRDIFDNITILELLNHTSGLTNNFLTFRYSYLGNLSKKDIIMLIEKTTQAKDKRFKYSNLGYNLFSVLLKEEFDKNWQDLLNEKLFTPLKMSHTSGYMSDAFKNKWILAQPYVGGYKDGLKKFPLKTDNTMHAAGGLISSASDAAKWLLYNINTGKLDNTQITASTAIKKSHIPTINYSKKKGQIFQGLSYSIGWHNATFNDNNDVIYHFGGYNGFQSHISFMPKEKIGIAVFTNEEHFGDNLSSIIASYIYEVLLEEPINENTYNQKLKDLTELERKLIENSGKKKLNETATEWNLTMPLKAYTGIYKNDFMGSMDITIKNKTLYVEFGELQAAAVASPEVNACKVELITNRTMNLKFIINNNTITGIDSGGLTFKKVE
ncbi:serine hydrolase domain-containing protein [Winogradskyella haliclonae]|uniref:Penicillin-binding protein n=1 Tax=Winogradskyella haliclonae TaxID=2048558 RepID=A0ABQ2C084_9FLAO|nr:serine hydrolase domain-containing protein [Winogradskyella haliclonae]GGI57605.1 penicillin-binding protein [Winogradskyella haliclonae]